MVLRLNLSCGYVTMISAYAPAMSYTQEAKECFYEDLEQVIHHTPHTDKLILLGDFNARVGKCSESWEKVIGPHGIGKVNTNGTLLLSLCARHELVITNTLFQQRNSVKTTWMHPRSGHWHQIDFVITRQRHSHDVHLTRALRGTTCHSDHRLLLSKIAFSFRMPQQHRRQKNRKKFNVHKLKLDSVRSELSTVMDQKLRSLEPQTETEKRWECLRDIFQSAAEEVLGLTKRSHQDWFDENDTMTEALLQKLHSTHLDYINDKASPSKRNTYLQTKRAAQTSLRRMKDAWWMERGKELQGAADRHDTKALYEGLRRIYGPKSRGISPLLSADGRTVLRDQQSIMARWVEHFDSVLNRVSTISDEAIDRIPQRPTIVELDESPSFDEVKAAVKQLSSGKSAGSDGIPPEIFKHCGATATSHLHGLFVSIWQHGQVPQEFKDALIVHLYKNKGDRKNCDNHRGISLLSIAGKILAKVVINRLTRNITEHITPESQCGFRPSRGTADMLFTARQVQEKCREQNKDLFMVFIDLTKAFDSVGRDGLWKLLKKAGCPPKLIGIIRSFHEGMFGRVMHDGAMSEPFAISNGTKQGCVMAPVLFSLVFSAMLQDAFEQNEKGISINFRYDGGIFNLRRLQAKTKTSSMLLRDLLYADDCALIAHTQSDAQDMVDDFARACSSYGLTISIRKSEVLHQPRPGTPPSDPVITIAGEPLKAVQKFCYLGGVLSQNARIDDITARIGKASAAFGRLQHRLWDERGVRLSTKIALYKAAVLSTLLYGGETWVTYRAHIRKLELFHMRCLRKICGIKWQDRVPNTDILARCNITSVEAVLGRSRLRWCGHLARMPDSRIPKAIFFGELCQGKRTTGGQHKRYKDVFKATLKSHNIDHTHWERLSEDRDEWRLLCHSGSEHFETNRTAMLVEKRRRRHMRHDEPDHNNNVFICHVCNRSCASRIGLFSHARTHSSTIQSPH